MSMDEHDSRVMYCRMLGHQVPFSYCRQTASGQPCRKIFDCWYQQFDIQQFMQSHYSQDQIDQILAPPKPKMTTLVELIRQAQENARNKKN